MTKSTCQSKHLDEVDINYRERMRYRLSSRTVSSFHQAPVHREHHPIFLFLHVPTSP